MIKVLSLLSVTIPVSHSSLLLTDGDGKRAGDKSNRQEQQQKAGPAWGVAQCYWATGLQRNRVGPGIW